MLECQHRILTWVPPVVQVRLRCRHCHLVISERELGAGPCPECLERDGRRRRDFDEVPASGPAPVRYCCEQCGALIEA